MSELLELRKYGLPIIFIVPILGFLSFFALHGIIVTAARSTHGAKILLPHLNSISNLRVACHSSNPVHLLQFDTLRNSSTFSQYSAHQIWNLGTTMTLEFNSSPKNSTCGVLIMRFGSLSTMLCHQLTVLRPGACMSQLPLSLFMKPGICIPN